MEFNPDGSLKVAAPEKEQENKATITLRSVSKPKEGTMLLLELHDQSLPYNLIEGQFHQLNTKSETECDAHLGKKSEMHYDVVVTGPDHQKWVDQFLHGLNDYMDKRIEIIREE